MKNLFLVMILFTLTGCASDPARLQALLDKLEFDDDEGGCVRLETNVGLMAVFGSGGTQITYKKSKPTATGPAPDC
jgi:hypothetical protein